MGGGRLIEDALLSPAVEVRSKSNDLTRSDRPSSSSSLSGRQQGRQPHESFHLKNVEKSVAATATITSEPKTIKKMNGAVWVNGFGGAEEAESEEVAEEELALEAEVEVEELELEMVGAEEDIRTAARVDVGVAFGSEDELSAARVLVWAGSV
jgi:hypothetical protein